MTSGIYAILNNQTGDFYIGSTQNFKQRKNRHFSTLRHNCHLNPKLQNAWNKYGEQTFEFLSLMECPKEDLIGWELYWYLELNPKYNCGEPASVDGGTRGFKHSSETLKKCGKASRNVPKSIETRRKMSESKQNHIGYGRTFSDDEVRNMRKIFIPKHPEFGYSGLARKYKKRATLIKAIIDRKTYKDVD